jgi:hypothetical protein
MRNSYKLTGKRYKEKKNFSIIILELLLAFVKPKREEEDGSYGSCS